MIAVGMVVRKSLIALSLVLGLTSVALAGPPEQLTQIETQPANPNHIVLRYLDGGEGLLISDDGAATWRAVPAEAIGVERNSRLNVGRVALAGDGELFVGTWTSLLHDDGTGCGFAEDSGFTGEWVSDLAHHPTDPDVLYAALSTAGAMNGVHRRNADGSWEAVGTTDELLMNRLSVVERAPGELRFYVSGSRGQLGMPPNNRANYIVRVSDDLGQTWTEYALEEVYGAFHVGAKVALEGVDPTNPDRILLSVSQDRSEDDPTLPPDKVLISSDAGATFQDYATLTQFGGLGFAPDGRVWIGDHGNSFHQDQPSGLYYAASLDEMPTKIEDTLYVACVQYLPDSDKVFVCQPNKAGLVAPDGTGYEQKLDFNEVPTFVSCQGTVDTTAVCQQLNTGWCGASHFPYAPMCCACPEASDVVDRDCPDQGTGGTGGMGGTAGGVVGGTGGVVGGIGGAGGVGGSVAGVGGGVAGGGGVAAMGGGAAAAAATGGSDSGDDSSGCGCVAPGRAPHSPNALLATLALGAFYLRRRRRR